jgi:hypothetical protein
MRRRTKNDMPPPPLPTCPPACPCHRLCTIFPPPAKAPLSGPPRGGLANHYSVPPSMGSGRRGCRCPGAFAGSTATGLRALSSKGVVGPFLCRCHLPLFPRLPASWGVCHPFEIPVDGCKVTAMGEDNNEDHCLDPCPNDAIVVAPVSAVQVKN